VNLMVGVKMARCVKLQRLKELKTQRLVAWKQFFHGIPQYVELSLKNDCMILYGSLEASASAP